MGTIIAHGKNQWGRSTKNKRTDSELEEELTAIESPKSIVTQETIILKDISDQVNVGTKVVKKIDDSIIQNGFSEIQNTKIHPTNSPTISHQSSVSTKNYKALDIPAEIVPDEPMRITESPKKGRKNKKVLVDEESTTTSDTPFK